MEKVKYQDIDGKYIIAWCQEHNEVEWLKAEANKKVKRNIYPKVQVEKQYTKNGETYTRKVSVYDRSQKPTVIEDTLPFVELKKAFVEKFMPELLKKEKKQSLLDIINSL